MDSASNYIGGEVKRQPYSVLHSKVSINEIPDKCPKCGGNTKHRKWSCECCGYVHHQIKDRDMGSALNCIGCNKDIVTEGDIHLLIVDDILHVEYTCPECGTNAIYTIHEDKFIKDEK